MTQISSKQIEEYDIEAYRVESKGVNLDEDVRVANNGLGHLKDLDAALRAVDSDGSSFHRHDV